MDVGFYKNQKHQKNQTVSNWGETYRVPSMKNVQAIKLLWNNILFPEQENKFNHHSFAM